MTPEEREKKAEEDAYKMEIQSNGWKNWPKGPGTYGEAAIVMDAGTGSILYAKILMNMSTRQVSQKS